MTVTCDATLARNKQSPNNASKVDKVCDLSRQVDVEMKKDTLLSSYPVPQLDVSFFTEYKTIARS